MTTHETVLLEGYCHECEVTTDVWGRERSDGELIAPYTTCPGCGHDIWDYEKKESLA